MEQKTYLRISYIIDVRRWLDRDPEPKIGAIAMALERRGEPTERGQLWREVVARNLDRFATWIALQRERLIAYGRGSKARW